MPIPQGYSWSPNGPPRHAASLKPASSTKDAKEASLRQNDGDPGETTSDLTLESTRHARPDVKIPEGPLCTNRAELMERIKRGESPTWVPSKVLQQEYLRENGVSASHSLHDSAAFPVSRIIAEGQAVPAQDIERPPSALHAGEFKPQSLDQASHFEASNDVATGWHDASDEHGFHDVAPWATGFTQRLPSTTTDQNRFRSFSSSKYVLKQPTTPLVYQATRSPSPDKALRRHTLPPAPLSTSPNRKAFGLPYEPDSHQTLSSSNLHHSRKSGISAWSLQPPPSPPTPAFLRSRRTSCSSETSARQRASMVGSYEESILHGRMSTAPSIPFNFYAHIGVLGRGKKPKMPPHVIVPFQAVFYDWPLTAHKPASASEPSPYVGEIDLCKRDDFILPTPNQDNGCTRSSAGLRDGSRGDDNMSLEIAPSDNDITRRRGTRGTIQVPWGSYRIPVQGQIQVVVKNLYKTALKLFLVPYDLSGMAPGQKTFVRQRYYSSGPVIERPVGADPSTQLPRKNLTKPTLRYLIHLKVCCPSKGHYYLYSNIRVVFANRVPDDKEYLTKDLQEPNPKYSPWKLNDSSYPSTPLLKQEESRAFRRRSSGFNFKDADNSLPGWHSNLSFSSPFTYTDIPPVPPIPFNLPPLAHQPKELHHPLGGESVNSHDRTSPSISERSLMDAPGIVTGEDLYPDSNDADSYIKLNQGDAGYGGRWSQAHSPELPRSLLARRLKGAYSSEEFDVGEALG